MATVLLTLFDPKDQGELAYDGKQASIALRQRRLTRITDQAGAAVYAERDEHWPDRFCNRQNETAD